MLLQPWFCRPLLVATLGVVAATVLLLITVALAAQLLPGEILALLHLIVVLVAGLLVGEVGCLVETLVHGIGVHVGATGSDFDGLGLNRVLVLVGREKLDAT